MLVRNKFSNKGPANDFGPLPAIPKTAMAIIFITSSFIPCFALVTVLTRVNTLPSDSPFADEIPNNDSFRGVLR